MAWTTARLCENCWATLRTFAFSVHDGLWCGSWTFTLKLYIYSLFDAVGLLYVVKSLLFYKVQYEHIKYVAGCQMCSFQISWGMFLPRIGKIE